MLASYYTCLLDKPFKPTWPEPLVLLGITYSMDEQCHLDFGTGYQKCIQVSMPLALIWHARQAVQLQDTCQQVGLGMDLQTWS